MKEQTDAIIKKKEDIIAEMKRDAERLNQQLISKDMENQNLKQSLMQLQDELFTLQNELEVLNQYTEQKNDA